MIRKTLPATKAATFSVMLPNRAQSNMPTPTGTGFFVSRDGWFVTAAHVVKETETGQVRSDISDGWLQKETKLASPESASWGSEGCQWPEVDFIDDRTDFALLKVDFERNATKDWLKTRDGFPFIHVSRRQLEDGEPVYAFGYPLSEGKVVVKGEAVSFGTVSLMPRTTSAVIASGLVRDDPIRTPNDPLSYVIDKPLNFGNSGGPIVATETGHVHALCASFQLMPLVQSDLRDGQGNPLILQVPSLYGIVSSLANPRILAAMEERGVSIADS